MTEPLDVRVKNIIDKRDEEVRRQSDFTGEIVSLVGNVVGDMLSDGSIEENLTAPKNESFGDISFPCHMLSREYKKAPQQIADDIVRKIVDSKSLDTTVIKGVGAVNGFVNFTFNDTYLVNGIINSINWHGDSYGSSESGVGKKVIIDYSAPNLGKPLHVGHIRSTITGDSLKRILEFTGHDVHGINYLGDVGLHIGKIIAAYERWGNDDRLSSEPEHEMFELYTRFERESKVDNSLNDEAKIVLNGIEAGNETYINLWNRIKDWSLDAFDRSYALLDVSFEETTGQSYFSKRGKEIVEAGKRLGVIKTGKEYKAESIFPKKELDCMKLDDESIVANIDNHKLHPKAVIRSDGSAIYCTQDLGAAVSRFEEHKFDKMLYAVANEQSAYFNQVFAILDNLGYEWADKCHHVGFGFINLEEGRMSTREGNVVFLEDVLGKAVDKAYEMIKDRDVGDEDKHDIAKKVGIGSLKYSVLSVELENTIKFSWDKTLDLHGKTAAYIQYTYVRAGSVLNGSTYKNHSMSDIREMYDPSDLTHPKERSLIKSLGEFPNKVQYASENLKPNIIGIYMFEVAKKFNEYYSDVKIIGSNEETSRQVLVDATRTVLRNASSLLGIQMPERM